MKYDVDNKILYYCRYHVVFCPKYKRPVLVRGVNGRLSEIIEETCEEMPVTLVNMKINSDYVYLILSVAPRFGIHKAVKKIKAKSSSILREEFAWLKSRIPSLWTHSYLVSTANELPLSLIDQYVFDQKVV